MQKDQYSFLEVMQSNSEQVMRDYLLHNGKKPKPISPFIFEKEKHESDNNLTSKEE